MPQLPSLPWTFTILTTGDSWSLWAQLRMLPGAHKLSFPSRYYPVSPAHAPPLLICTLFWVWEAIALLLPWCSAPLHLLCDGPSLSRASTGTLPLLPSTHSLSLPSYLVLLYFPIKKSCDDTWLLRTQSLELLEQWHIWEDSVAKSSAQGGSH